MRDGRRPGENDITTEAIEQKQFPGGCFPINVLVGKLLCACATRKNRRVLSVRRILLTPMECSSIASRSSGSSLLLVPGRGKT